MVWTGLDQNIGLFWCFLLQLKVASIHVVMKCELLVFAKTHKHVTFCICTCNYSSLDHSKNSVCYNHIYTCSLHRFKEGFGISRLREWSWCNRQGMDRSNERSLVRFPVFGSWQTMVVSGRATGLKCSWATLVYKSVDPH